MSLPAIIQLLRHRMCGSNRSEPTDQRGLAFSLNLLNFCTLHDFYTRVKPSSYAADRAKFSGLTLHGGRVVCSCVTAELQFALIKFSGITESPDKSLP